MHTVGEAPSSVPAFLGKLWKLVEDPTTNHLISWNPNGLSFTIRDQARFARELLPLYYKHNNMASFVRQLNMYGFHKVVSVDSGGLKVDKDEMEFAHMYFLQGQEFLLEHIKRKIPVSKQDDSKHNKPEVLSRVLAEVRSMKGKQESVDSRLATMKRENEALWREVASLRQKHMKQQQIVNKLIQFLISIVQPNGHGTGLGHKRRYPLMLREARSKSRSSEEKEHQCKEKDNGRLKDFVVDGLTNRATVSLVSSNGPIIHDVTDLEDETGVELDVSAGTDDGILEAKDGIEESVLIPEALATDELSISATDNDGTAIDESLEEEVLSAGQPDLDTVAQLEAGTSDAGTGIVDRAMMASPLSPDLMMAVDPREVNSGALLSFEESRKGKEPETSRGKSVVKKQETAVAVTEIPRLDKDEFDNHLDTMQMDLEQLREVLSLQGTPMDASTLLGVCNSLNLESDSPINWPSDTSAAAWSRRNLPSDTTQLYNNLLEHQILAKLFSADDQLSGSFFPIDMDLFRSASQGAITGNEVVAFNNSPFFEAGNDDGSQFLDHGDFLKAEPVDEKETPDLFDLLTESPAATPATGPSSAKKKKRN